MNSIDSLVDALPVLCLASASPRRREILRQMGVPHIFSPADLDETLQYGEMPADYVLRLATAKAQLIYSKYHPNSSVILPVLGADTSVVFEGQILGKPNDLSDLKHMLGLLAGRKHEVITAVAVVNPSSLRTCLVRSEVVFRPISITEIERYWASGEPRDKAGGYAIQGLGGVFIKRIKGSYSGIVGLPIFETAELLTASGIPLWRPEL